MPTATASAHRRDRAPSAALISPVCPMRVIPSRSSRRPVKGTGLHAGQVRPVHRPGQRRSGADRLTSHRARRRMTGRLRRYLGLARRFHGRRSVLMVRRSCSTPAHRVERSSGKTGDRRAVRACPGSRRGMRGCPILQAPLLGATDSKRRNRRGIRGVLFEVSSPGRPW